jgi:hypothetical protein
MDGFSTGSRDEFEFDELSISEKGAHAEDLFDDTSPSHALARILGRPLHEVCLLNYILTIFQF